MRRSMTRRVLTVFLAVLALGSGRPGSVSAQEFGFQTVDAAGSVVDRIMEAFGMPRDFLLREDPRPGVTAAAGIDQCTSAPSGQCRFIVYNPAALLSIEQETDEWGPISVMAHEVAHHLLGHTVSEEGSNPSNELSADYWTGFALQKLGASLESAQAVMRLRGDPIGSASHPPRRARLEEIEMGWRAAANQGDETADLDDLLRRVDDREDDLRDALRGLRDAEERVQQAEERVQQATRERDEAVQELEIARRQGDRADLVLNEPEVNVLDEVNMWTFDGTAGDVVVGVSSTDFDPEVSLMSLAGEVIGTDDDGGDGLNALLITELPVPGRYRVDVRSVDGRSGEYEVVVRTVRNLTPGVSSRGFLRGSAGDIWTFEGGAGTLVRVDVGSDSFDTVVVLRSPTGVELAVADDIDGVVDTNSRLAEFLSDSGRHFVEVRSYGSTGGGDYSVSVELFASPAPPAPPAPRISPRCSRQVSVERGGGRYERNDTLDGNCVTVHSLSEKHAVYYGFTLDRDAFVAIEMTSSDVDSWLTLRSGTPPGDDVALEDDDDGGSSAYDARIEQLLEAGQYTIEATTWAEDETGDFTLTLTVNPVNIPSR